MTLYIPAVQEDEPDIRELIAISDVPQTKLGYPTILAKKEDEVVGVISTNPDEEFIMVEPLIAPNGFIFMRLIEHMETALKKVGCSSGLFRVPKVREKMYNIASKRPDIFTLVAENDAICIYRRDF